MRRLIVLRPEPGATATCQAARRRGLEPVAIPLFAVEPAAWEAPDPAPFDGLLATSANAFRHGGPGLQRLRGLPVHAVGDATAQAARAAGFSIASAGRGGIDALLGTLEGELRLLHLCGADRRIPSSPRQEVVALPVYRAAALPAPDMTPLAGAVAAVHSPRAGARLAELVESAGLDRSSIAIAAISEDALRSAGFGWQGAAAASEPSEDALLALAAELCNTEAR